MFSKVGSTFVLALVMAALVAEATTGCTRKVDPKDTTINTVLKANVKGLDPINANDQYASTVAGQIYEGLLQYNYLKRPYELEPLLAEAMPSVSADGRTYTFKIRKGIRFQDNAAFASGKGREVTAEDFIYSFKRLADPKMASEGFWIFDGKVAGLNEWVDQVKAGKADYKTAVEGLQAPDAHTLVIKLNKPYYQLNYVLAMTFASVVPHEAVEKYGQEFLNNPVGTGAFMLEKSSDWIRNSTITLKRNPNFHDEKYPSAGEKGDQEAGLLADAGKQLPFAEKLVFTELPEDQPRWQNFVKGNFEFAEIPNDNFDSAMKDGKVAVGLAGKGVGLAIAPNLDTTFKGLNMNDPFLGKHKEVRQAMNLATDRATLIQRFYNGRAVPAEGPIPPDVEGYEDRFKSPYSFNITKAKELLAKAGFEGGKGIPELTLEIPGDSKNRQMGEFFAQEMAVIGIKVRINSSTWPQFQEKVKKGQAQIFGMAWGADYPDAQNFFQLYYSRNVSPGPNDSGYKSAEFDKLYEKSLALAPGKERNAVYSQLRKLIVEDSPWIFDSHRMGYFLFHGWLKNFKRTEMPMPNFKYLRVDGAQRAEMKPKL
jgi:oligopeptide transport system substrate-binding protein